MNQILTTPKKMKYKYFFKIELIISLLVILISLIYMCNLIYQENERNKISSLIVEPYSISKLYSKLEIEYSDKVQAVPFVMGTLEIPSLKITLPIISEMNDDLLKLSVCRFYGPMKISVGNICIAGHNYNDNSFFSNLPKISIGDTINVTDSFNNSNTFSVYEKYEITSSDTSCTSQNTNGQKEITLVTCNNFTGNRVIVKAHSI